MYIDGLISVIIPVYNVEKYLAACVDSVLAQSYQNFELILVDDGSKDRSPRICDEYAAADPRIRCFHKQNGGASSARNVGLDHASGEYIFFLDSDDWLDRSALEKLIAPLRTSDADFSFCEAVAVDEDTGRRSLTNYSYHRDYGTGVPARFLTEMLAHKEFHVAVWMCLYRADFLTGSTLRFVEHIMYEDCIFTYRLYRQAKRSVHIHESLYYRRWRQNSVMTAKKTAYNFTSAKRVYDEVIRAWESFGSPAEDRPYVVRIAFNAITTYRALPSERKKALAAEYRQLIQDISARHAFSDRGLAASCRGKIPWLMYKIAEKITGSKED